MIKTKLNYPNLIIRLIILFILLLILNAIETIPSGPASNTGSSLVALSLVLIILFLVIASFCGIMKVQINANINLITVSGACYRKSLKTAEIIGYYQSIERSRRRNFNGLIILLNNSKSLEIIEYNIKSIVDIEQYLVDNNIPLLGKRRSWFPFRRPLK